MFTQWNPYLEMIEFVRKEYRLAVCLLSVTGPVEQPAEV